MLNWHVREARREKADGVVNVVRQDGWRTSARVFITILSRLAQTAISGASHVGPISVYFIRGRAVQVCTERVTVNE